MNINKVPTEIRLHKKSATLELAYTDDTRCQLRAEFLRVHSPSAEVRGHGKGQETLQVGKKNVMIVEVEPIGNYAIKLTFDDGHNTGIYSWDYLRELCSNHDQLWDDYLGRLKAANGSRDVIPSGVQVVNIMPLSTKESPDE